MIVIGEETHKETLGEETHKETLGETRGGHRKGTGMIIGGRGGKDTMRLDQWVRFIESHRIWSYNHRTYAYILKLLPLCSWGIPNSGVVLM